MDARISHKPIKLEFFWVGLRHPYVFVKAFQVLPARGPYRRRKTNLFTRTVVFN